MAVEKWDYFLRQFVPVVYASCCIGESNITDEHACGFNEKATNAFFVVRSIYIHPARRRWKG